MEKTILFADDDPAFLKIYSDVLTSSGYHIIQAKDGEEAIGLYHKYLPDLVILDLTMPKKDGFEVAAEIRETDPVTPIFFLTANTDEKTGKKSYEKMVNDYIRKGIKTGEFVAKIKNYFATHPVITRQDQINITPDTSVNFSTFTLFTCSRSIVLSKNECKLLRSFLHHKNVPLERDALIESIWADYDYTGDNHMNKAVTQLRKYLEADKRIKITVKRKQSITFEVDDTPILGFQK